MRRKLTNKFSWILPVALALFMSFAFFNHAAYAQSDTSYSRYLKPHSQRNYFKNKLHLVMPPIKPAVISTQKVNAYKSDDKLLNNVQVYPNPVTDVINLKYNLSRYSYVTIKIMDVLGNDVITIFSQRLEPGEKTCTYALNSKLSRGFYFVRIYAGTESVIKRISVL